MVESVLCFVISNLESSLCAGDASAHQLALKLWTDQELSLVDLIASATATSPLTASAIPGQIQEVTPEVTPEETDPRRDEASETTGVVMRLGLRCLMQIAQMKSVSARIEVPVRDT